MAGKIKTYPADFVVEEIPLYEPCGEGEHLYLTVCKTNMSHDECVLQVAKAFHVSPRDIGCAGRKDFHAVTTQVLSVYLRDKKPEVPESIGNIEVRSFSYHANKLRLGHLVGNDPSAVFSSDEHGEYIELQFALPAGSYATVVLEYCLGQSSWFKEVSE